MSEGEEMQSEGKSIYNEDSNVKEFSLIRKMESESYSIGKSFEYSAISYKGEGGMKLKMKNDKLFSEILSKHIEQIFDYLNIVDIDKMRRINHAFLVIVHEYYKKRLKLEISKIIAFQDNNNDKTKIFMRNIDNQIPLSNYNWLDFDIRSVTTKLHLLDRNILIKLRSIKSIGKLSDVVYAPFCIIFGYTKAMKVENKKTSWKSTAGKILSDSNLIIRISNLDLENMCDSDMINAFHYLNLPELDIYKIRKFSSDFAKFIIWCQAVVSYHIIIHPYKIRNNKCLIKDEVEVYKFAEKIDLMINKFYKFKRFLYNLNICKIPISDYVFNLRHNRVIPQKSKSIINNLSHLNIGNILSYIPFMHSYKLMSVSKKFFDGFKNGIDLIILEILKEIYFFKLQAYDKISTRIPVIYSYSIFSNYFLMLDDVLNSNLNEPGLTFIPFLTKEHLNDLKQLKINTPLAITISKVFCIITEEKPLKHQSIKCALQYKYIDKVRSLILSGKLLKTMRNVNKLSLSEKKIKILRNELINFNSISKLEEVKKTNHGLYQLLIWELFVLEYLKAYNPFDFISSEYINKRYEQEEIDMVKYYVEIMNYLKYNFKIKYHFNKGGRENKSPSLGMGKLITELRKYLIIMNIYENHDFIFNTTNVQQAKIAHVYFENKELIPIGARPTLFEKIIIEILSSKEKDEQINSINIDISDNNNNNNDNNDNNNDDIKKQSENNINQSDNNKNNLTLNEMKRKIKSIMNCENFLFSYYKKNNIKKSKLSSIPNEIIISNILFYLDINTLPKFSLVCRKTNECTKTHIFIRLIFLNEEKKSIESKHSEIIESINTKRQQYYKDNKISLPSKQNAFSLMSKITFDDINEIKQCFKNYNKNYEVIISPLLILLGEREKKFSTTQGEKGFSYYQTAKNFLFKKGLINRIRSLEVETIPSTIIKTIEKIVQDPLFYSDNKKFLSPCFYHLISWIKGVIEFFRVVRKYSCNSYDLNILTKKEINFCNEMDYINLLYFKLVRYATNHCKKYKQNAYEIMVSMNIQSNNNSNSISNINNNSNIKIK